MMIKSILKYGCFFHVLNTTLNCSFFMSAIGGDVKTPL